MFVVFFGALDELAVQDSLAVRFEISDEHSDGRTAFLIFRFPVALATQRQKLLGLIFRFSGDLVLSAQHRIAAHLRRAYHNSNRFSIQRQ